MRVHPTPLAAAPRGDLHQAARAQAGRRFPDAAAPALLAHGQAEAARAALLEGAAAITTGQQAGLFTGPLFTIHKALTAAALAAELAGRRGAPVVPVHWVAGDDHDFAEVNHCAVIGLDGVPVTVTLRDRAAEAALTPMFREPVGPDGAAALAAVAAALPSSEFRDDAMAWLQRAYAPDRSLAEAHAQALAELLAPFGVVVCRGWHGALKRAGLPVLFGALEQAAELDAALAAEAQQLVQAGVTPPVAVGDGLTLVMVEGRGGRDRLRLDAPGRFVTRRSGETFTLDELRAVANADPERLSANVLLRGVVEAAVIPTAAYVAGPAELSYVAQTGPVFGRLGVPRPAAVPRLSALLVEAKADKVLEKHGLAPEALARDEGDLATALARDAMPPAAHRALTDLRAALHERWGAVTEQAAAIDPTLEKTVIGARNQALAGAQDVERKLVAALKRRQDTALAQVLRARAQLYPGGRPQERVITVASFLARHGRAVLDALYDAARAAARRYLEAPPSRS